MAKSDCGKPAREGYSREYEVAWLKLYGKKCPNCKGEGAVFYSNYSQEDCKQCNGSGYVEKNK